MTTHEAGRELDALIERNVMEIIWDETRCRICGWPLAGAVEDGCTKGSCSMRPKPHVRADEPPHYSTDIAAAWTIIEHFYNAGWGAGASMDGHTGCEASIGQFVARADTAPLAICLAALEATL